MASTFPTAGLVDGVTTHTEFGVRYTYRGGKWVAESNEFPTPTGPGFLHNDGAGAMTWQDSTLTAATSAVMGGVMVAADISAAGDAAKVITPTTLKAYLTAVSAAVSRGTRDKDKYVQLNAAGKLDSSLFNFSALNFKGAVDVSIVGGAPEPATKAHGDTYFVKSLGSLANWEGLAATEVVSAGSLVVYNGIAPTGWDVIVGSVQLDNSTTAVTGGVIDFTGKKMFNTALAPFAGNITDNLVGAKIGIVQKIYHLAATPPTYPACWTKIGATNYVPNTLNIIYCEYHSAARVEYWIIQ